MEKGGGKECDSGCGRCCRNLYRGKWYGRPDSDKDRTQYLFWTGFLCICRKSAGDCRRRELCRKLRISWGRSGIFGIAWKNRTGIWGTDQKQGILFADTGMAGRHLVFGWCCRRKETASAGRRRCVRDGRKSSFGGSAGDDPGSDRSTKSGRGCFVKITGRNYRLSGRPEITVWKFTVVYAVLPERTDCSGWKSRRCVTHFKSEESAGSLSDGWTRKKDCSAVR